MGSPKPATGHSPHTSDTAGSADRRALQYPGRLLFISSDGGERSKHAEYLLDRGYCVLETQTPAEASRLTEDVWLSAVITDVQLSEGQDALCLSIQLGRRAPVRRTPVVVPMDPDNGLEAVERSGCDLTVAKPCAPEVLARLTGRLVEAGGQRSGRRAASRAARRSPRRPRP